MSDNQSFEHIISQEDYKQLKSWQIKHNQLSKEHQIIQEQRSLLHKIIQDQKKSIYMKNQQIDYLKKQIHYFCDTLLGCENQLKQITKSHYEDLTSKEKQGISTIFHEDITTQIKQQHKDVLKRLHEVQVKFQISENKYKQMTQLIEEKEKLTQEDLIIKQNRLSQIISEVQKNQEKLEESTLSGLAVMVQTLQNRLKLMQKEFEVLLEKKLQAQKKYYHLKAQRDKQASQPKIYAIKGMIDEYYQGLQSHLGQFGGLQRKQIETILLTQLNGITQYINVLIKKTFVTDVKNKK